MGGNNSAIFGKHHSLTGVDYLTLAGLGATGFGAAGMGPLAALGGAGAGAAGEGAALGGMGGGTASMFGPSALSSSILGDIGGGSSIPMLTAGEGLGEGGAGLSSLGASNAELGTPSMMAQLQGFFRPGGQANNALSSYGKVNAAMNSAGFGGRPPAAPPGQRPTPPSEPLYSSGQVLGPGSRPQIPTGSAGMVGQAMSGGEGGISPQLMQLLAMLKQGGQA